MLEDVTLIAELVGSLTVIVGALVLAPKWYAALKVKENEAKTHEEEQDDSIKELEQGIKKVNQEQAILCKSILACLDGLHQLGANGKVTSSLNELEEYINMSAHNH